MQSEDLLLFLTPGQWSCWEALSGIHHVPPWQKNYSTSGLCRGQRAASQTVAICTVGNVMHPWPSAWTDPSLNRDIHNYHSGFLLTFTSRMRKNLEDTTEQKQTELRCSSPKHNHTQLTNCPQHGHRKASAADWTNSRSSNWKHSL